MTSAEAIALATALAQERGGAVGRLANWALERLSEEHVTAQTLANVAVAAEAEQRVAQGQVQILREIIGRLATAHPDDRDAIIAEAVTAAASCQ